MSVNLFNANLYRSLYPDLARAGLTTDEQLRQHFLTNGINEGRTFSSFINLNYYKVGHSDLGKAGLTTNQQLFAHLENFGASEGRRVSVAFNPNYYQAIYPDLKAAGLSTEQLYQHYEQFGIKEGRIGSEFFDPVYYLNVNPDVKAAFGNNYQLALNHFLNNGIQEGRISALPISPAFDPGNTTETSYGIGLLLTRPTYKEFLGTSDQQDMYSFILDKPSNFQMSLGAAIANVKLYADSNNNEKIDPGEEILSTRSMPTRWSGYSAYINQNLAQGRYYLDIVTGSPTESTSYSMSLGASAISTTTPSDPGNTAAEALDVGNLIGNSRSYQDFVGTNDRNDLYRLVLSNTATLNLSLSNVSNFVTANVYVDVNNDGAVTPNEYVTGTIASSTNAGSILRSLGAGTYYVDIVPSTPDPTINSSYTLSMSA